MDRLVTRGLATAGTLVALLVAGPGPAASWHALTRPSPTADPTAPVVAAATLLGELLAGLLVVAIALVLAARVPGPAGRSAARLARRVLPRVLRRVLEVALGAGVTAAIVSGAPAFAAAPSAPPPAVSADLDWPGTGPTEPTRPAPTARPPAPGVPPTGPPTASTPAGLPGAAALPSPAQPAAGRAHVVVRPGDTLWGLAERELRKAAGAAPSAARIAVSWPAWWAANRQLVGADPDLIQPGTALHPPASSR